MEQPPCGGSIGVVRRVRAEQDDVVEFEPLHLRPPMGLALTIKRVRRRLALNFSIHDRLADQTALAQLADAVRTEVEAYAASSNR